MLLLLVACASDPPPPPVPLVPSERSRPEVALWYAAASHLGWTDLLPLPGLSERRAAEACTANVRLACDPASWTPEGFAAGCLAGDAHACVYARFAEARDGRLDPPAAVAAFDVDCARGDLLACAALGISLRESGEVARGAEQLQGACGAGWGPACAELGAMAWRPPAVTEWQLAQPALAEGCRVGDPHSCYGLASVLGPERDPSDVAASHRRGCAEGLVPACGELLEGDGAELARDVLGPGCAARREAACVWLAVACAKSDAPACRALGEAYAGWPENATRGAEALARACALGEVSACAGEAVAEPR